MSGGEAKRAALAAALISAPGVLIADDPATSLDTALKYAVWNTLRVYADAGAAVLTVTNDVEILSATSVADRVIVMDQGRVVAMGESVDEVIWDVIRPGPQPYRGLNEALTSARARGCCSTKHANGSS